MNYQFNEIEKKWQQIWEQTKINIVEFDISKPKYYVLDMFPYPSGTGLHVGHPLGYIASDIYARYKKLNGFNVLHPMGYDAFGLPAEQFAIEHGIHPAVSTKNNIHNFRNQLDKIGFCFDWSREVNTSIPTYYKWTQWIFLQLFNSFYNRNKNKAEPIEKLITDFEKEGNIQYPNPNSQNIIQKFSASDWIKFNEKTQQDILMNYRLAYSGYGEVNWCEALGTVLANDEVINGVSERGGHAVVKKKLRQWYLRITEYADRLLEGLNKVEFSDAMKEMQNNWIGKSIGAEITFQINQPVTSNLILKVYTTRPDTIFGVDFLVLAPENELIEKITTPNQKKEVDDYIEFVKSRSERERMAEKKISGVFTGTFAIHPFNGKNIPIWISEYVLVGYGTGAIMAVPCGDERDFKFAKLYNIPITNIIGNHFNNQEANPTKEAILENSDFLNGTVMHLSTTIVIDKLEKMNIAKRKINYKMRDAAFSRQRYWGEPFPIVWKNDIAYALENKDLPLKLPEVINYKPGPNGQGPLANIKEWEDKNFETSTMPGYAGSSWYFLRYMDPKNDEEFCSKNLSNYWNQVDLYIGGTEHAVGHLLYSRMWTKFLYDLNLIGFDEPFKKLVNQGMITGKSYFFAIENNQIISFTKENENTSFVRFKFGHQFVDNKGKLTKQQLNKAIKEYQLENIHKIQWQNDGVDEFICLKEESEKMSKSKFNVDSPDELCQHYGADTFRMYEMFLGPLEMSKPWDTKGIEGVHRFLKKLWRLFYSDEITLQTQQIKIINKAETEQELKILHKAIKKISEDTERLSFNTAVSAFMVCVNELTEIKCNNKNVIEPLLIMLAPYAPHISEELWHLLGNKQSIFKATYPSYNSIYLQEVEKEYPISINGKLRTTIHILLSATQQEAEKIVLSNETVKKWIENKPIKKIIYVKGKMVNIVI